MRRFAAEVMAEGQPVPDDPWLHLIQARGYGLIGETELARAEVAAATAAAPDDAEIWLAVAKFDSDSVTLAAKAEEAMTRAVDAAANDPTPLIKRARRYAERGERDKAEADYAKAAALTTDELNKFLEAGWWVAGPYPSEIREFCPPELDHDPAIPVHLIDATVGLSDEPVKWSRISTGDFGELELESLSAAKGNVSVYAMSHVYSPAETTATLCISATKDARVWLNGELVRHFTPGTNGYWSRDPERIPIVLRSGLNRILVKGTADSQLTIRLGDHPYDRGMELARWGEWKTAADLVEQGMRRHQGIGADPSSAIRLAWFRLAAGDIAAAQQLFNDLKEIKKGTTDQWWQWTMVQIGGVQPLRLAQSDELLAWMQNSPPKEHSWLRAITTLAPLRAGRWQAVIDHCYSDLEIQSCLAETSPLLAIAHHHLGHTAEADLALANMQTGLASRRNEWASRWIWNDVLLALLLPREAAETVHGNGSDIERQFYTFYEQRQADRARFTPETFDFDAAVYVYPHSPHLYIARGKRLVELGGLGELDEAQSDFDKAVQLSPGDPEVLLARCLFHAETGNIEAAADDAWTIFSIGFGSQYDSLGYHVEGLLAEQEPILLELLRRHPQNSALHRIRGDFLAYRGRWAEAREAYTTGSPWWSQEACGAALSVLLNEPEEFDRCLQRVEGLWDPGNADAQLLVHLRALMKLLQPMPPAEAEKLVSDLKELLAEKDWRSFRGTLGIAELRSGKFQDAINSLIAAHGPEKFWQSLPHLSAPLAMAHWHVGEQDEARRILSRSATYIDLFFRHLHQSRSSGGTGTFDHLWLSTIALHREARTLIDGIEAAEQELTNLFRSDPQEPAPRLTKQERLETYWNKAIEAEANNPLPLITRGRWYFERGQTQKAEADFAKAAELTPNELNRFLKAGWWVAGPYPAELKQFCPPELDPDPAVPVQVIDPQAGLSDLPVKWHNISTNSSGQVELSGVSGWKKDCSFYGLTYVHSPVEQTVMLLVPRDQPLRLWLNGQFVDHHTPVNPAVQPWYADRRIPVTLRSGNNQLLVKSNSPSFRVSTLTTPMDMVISLVEQDRFHEAGKALASGIEQALNDLQDGLSYQAAMTFLPLALQDDRSVADRACVDLMRHLNSTSDEPLKAWIVWAVTLRSNAAFDVHADECINAAEAVARQVPQHRDYMLIAALTNYRAGRFAEAAQWADEAGPDEWWQPPLRGLIAHRLQDSTTALACLEKSRSLLNTQFTALKIHVRTSNPQPWTSSRSWYARLALQSLLLEAEQTIAPDQPDSRTRMLQMEQELADWWALSPETTAFDQAVCSTTFNESRSIVILQPFIARAKRLAELGRFDEAAADFNKAVELQPNDRDMLIERARFHAQRGNAELAAADIDAASKASTQAKLATYPWTDSVDLEFLQLPEIGEQIAGRRKTRQSLFTVKALLNARNGDTEGAVAAIAQLRALAKFLEAGAASLILNDPAMYEEICREAIQTQHSEGERLWLLLLSPAAAVSPEEVLALGEKLLPVFSGNPLARPFLGMAYYRAGRYPEAIAQFNIGVRQPQPWQMAAISWPGMAMAKHRLGLHAEAKQWLDRTAYWLSLHTQGDKLNPAAFGEHNIRFVEFATVELFYREAKALIEADPE